MGYRSGSMRKKIVKSQNKKSDRLKQKMNKEQQAKIFELRNNFSKSLAKLNSNDTKIRGMKELQGMIRENTDMQSLRIYLSLLCEKHKNATTQNKELIVVVLGFIAKVYRCSMIDPLDKPPNLIKTVVRVCEEIHSYLKISNNVVHKACARSLIEVFEACIPNKDDKLTVSLIFYEPLAAIIRGGSDKVAQISSSHCMLFFVQRIIEMDYKDLINYLCPKLIALYLKSRCSYADFSAILSVLLEGCGIKYFVGCLTELFDKLNKIITDPSKQAHLDKIEACKLLGNLAVSLQSVADLVIGYYKFEVMQALECGTRDRVMKVQKSAMEAKKKWQDLEEVYENMEEKKQVEELNGMTPDELIKVRTGYGNVDDSKSMGLISPKKPQEVPSPSKKSLKLGKKYLKKLSVARALNKQQKNCSQVGAEEERLLEEKLDLAESNWGDIAKGVDFLRRSQGTGGGHVPDQYGQLKSQLRKKTKRQNIREIMKRQLGKRTGSLSRSGGIEIFEGGKRFIRDRSPDTAGRSGKMRKQRNAQSEERPYTAPEYKTIGDRDGSPDPIEEAHEQHEQSMVKERQPSKSRSRSRSPVKGDKAGEVDEGEEEMFGSEFMGGGTEAMPQNQDDDEEGDDPAFEDEGPIGGTEALPEGPGEGSLSRPTDGQNTIYDKTMSDDQRIGSPPVHGNKQAELQQQLARQGAHPEFHDSLPPHDGPPQWAQGPNQPYPQGQHPQDPKQPINYTLNYYGALGQPAHAPAGQPGIQGDVPSNPGAGNEGQHQRPSGVGQAHGGGHSQKTQQPKMDDSGDAINTGGEVPGSNDDSREVPSTHDAQKKWVQTAYGDLKKGLPTAEDIKPGMPEPQIFYDKDGQPFFIQPPPSQYEQQRQAPQSSHEGYPSSAPGSQPTSQNHSGYPQVQVAPDGTPLQPQYQAPINQPNQLASQPDPLNPYRAQPQLDQTNPSQSSTPGQPVLDQAKKPGDQVYVNPATGQPIIDPVTNQYATVDQIKAAYPDAMPSASEGQVSQPKSHQPSDPSQSNFNSADPSQPQPNIASDQDFRAVRSQPGIQGGVPQSHQNPSNPSDPKSQGVMSQDPSPRFSQQPDQPGIQATSDPSQPPFTQDHSTIQPGPDGNPVVADPNKYESQPQPGAGGPLSTQSPKTHPGTEDGGQATKTEGGPIVYGKRSDGDGEPSGEDHLGSPSGDEQLDDLQYSQTNQKLQKAFDPNSASSEPGATGSIIHPGATDPGTAPGQPRGTHTDASGNPSAPNIATHDNPFSDTKGGELDVDDLNSFEQTNGDGLGLEEIAADSINQRTVGSRFDPARRDYEQYIEKKGQVDEEGNPIESKGFDELGGTFGDEDLNDRASPSRPSTANGNGTNGDSGVQMEEDASEIQGTYIEGADGQLIEVDEEGHELVETEVFQMTPEGEVVKVKKKKRKNWYADGPAGMDRALQSHNWKGKGGRTYKDSDSEDEEADSLAEGDGDESIQINPDFKPVEGTEGTDGVPLTFVAPSGRLVDATGKLVDGKGNYVDPKGKVIGKQPKRGLPKKAGKGGGKIKGAGIVYGKRGGRGGKGSGHGTEGAGGDGALGTKGGKYSGKPGSVRFSGIEDNGETSGVTGNSGIQGDDTTGGKESEGAGDSRMSKSTKSPFNGSKGPYPPQDLRPRSPGYNPIIPQVQGSPKIEPPQRPMFRSYKDQNNQDISEPGSSMMDDGQGKGHKRVSSKIIAPQERKDSTGSGNRNKENELKEAGFMYSDPNIHTTGIRGPVSGVTPEEGKLDLTPDSELDGVNIKNQEKMEQGLFMMNNKVNMLDQQLHQAQDNINKMNYGNQVIDQQQREVTRTHHPQG